MRCIICDKCKAIIEDPKQVRILTCTQDVIWDKELCVKCAMEIEALVGSDSEGIKQNECNR